MSRCVHPVAVTTWNKDMWESACFHVGFSLGRRESLALTANQCLCRLVKIHWMSWLQLSWVRKKDMIPHDLFWSLPAVPFSAPLISPLTALMDKVPPEICTLEISEDCNTQKIHTPTPCRFPHEQCTGPKAHSRIKKLSERHVYGPWP